MTDTNMTHKDAVSVADELAQFIRTVDGNNSLGAGALAEKICDWFALRSAAPNADDKPVAISPVTDPVKLTPELAKRLWPTIRGLSPDDTAVMALRDLASGRTECVVRGEGRHDGVHGSVEGARPSPPDDAVLREAVNRFLAWQLPDDFSPDCYVAFDAEKARRNKGWPIGTNLLSATQAEAMLRFVLASSTNRSKTK